MVIVWNRIDQPGKEWCQLRHVKAGNLLEGFVIMTYDRQPYRFEYSIECDRAWQTRAATIEGHLGRKEIALELRVNARKEWRVGRRLVPGVKGCVDIDLGFSPSTNLIPIRRLQLGIGEEARVTAAWVEFPTLEVKPLEQSYLKLKEGVYHYESAGGQFKRDLKVNEEGFVTSYGGLWEMEAVC